MPKRVSSAYGGYYNTSEECWAVYTELLAAEYENAFLFGRVHQLTVDTYAVQHAGGPHPDKSVAVHLSGLHLVFEKHLQPTAVPPLLQLLVARVDAWPHFPPPDLKTSLTVFDVTLSSSVEEHLRLVRQWAGLVWNAWSAYHLEIANFVAAHLGKRTGIRDLEERG